MGYIDQIILDWIDSLINNSVIGMVFLCVSLIVVANLFALVGLYICYKYRYRIKSKFLLYFLLDVNMINMIGEISYNSFISLINEKDKIYESKENQYKKFILSIVDVHNYHNIFKVNKVKEWFSSKIYFRFRTLLYI